MDINIYLQIIENAPISIIITDKNRKIVYANKFFQKNSGYSLDEIKNKSPKIWNSEYNENFYPDLVKNISNGKPWDGIFLNKKKDGTKVWEHVYIYPLKDYYIAYKIDVTDKKNLEEQLLNANLKAKESEKIKSEFIANISHEIRTPLNGIIGFVDLLMEKEEDEQKLNYLKIVKESSNTLLNLINDILDLSKLEAKKMEFQEMNFNLKELILDCIDTFKLKAEQKGIEIKYYIDENIPDFIKGDKYRVLQILNNLISNAVKFTEKGYVKIGVELLEKNKKNVKIKFCVEDTGIGIEPEKIDKIFEVFTQADGSITRRFGGTGLGLAITKEIISNLNGKLEVESEKGKGSKFTFTLSFLIGDEILISQHKKDVDLSRLKILIAEDDEFNQEFFREICNILKIKADIVDNGKKVLEKLNENNYNLIFLDINMPVLNGVETAKRILEMKKDYPLIAITGESSDSFSAELFTDYLQKPFTIESFVNIIKKHADLKESFKIEDIIDLKALEEIIDENEELKQTLIKVFIENCKEIVEKMERAINNNDMKELNRAIHSLKGTSGDVKAYKIFDLSLELERFFNQNNMEKLYSTFKELKNIITNLTQ